MHPLDQVLESISGSDLLETIGAAIAAMAALGTAAYGLVDATKAFDGGISRIGFAHIRRGCEPFSGVLRKAIGGDGWQDLLRAQWINGRDKEEQKAVVRSLVRLGLTEGAVEDIALLTNVDRESLERVVDMLRAGQELGEHEFNILGRVDSIIGVRIDAAFEKADHHYKHAARLSAAVVSIVLALVAAASMQGGLEQNLWASLAAGILAVPIAPIAKDLVTSLSAAARAVAAVKGR